MIKVKVEKIFLGRVDIKSYDWERAKKTGQGIIFYLVKRFTDGSKMAVGKMMIKHDELDKGVHYNQVFKSKFKGGRDYHLVGFRWKADSDEQQLQFDIDTTVKSLGEK